MVSEEAAKGNFAWIPFPVRLAFAGCLLIGFSTMFLTTIDNSFKVAVYAGIGVTGLCVGVILLMWAMFWAMENS